MPTDGPKSLDDVQRRLLLGPPMLRIWDAAGTTLERVCVWDAARNQYHYDALDWADDPDADPTRTENRTVYEHVRVVRLHAALSFHILHPQWSPASAQRPPIGGFTELDLAALDNARLAGKVIEFYPHGNAGAAVDNAYVVNVVKASSGRGAGQWEHMLSLQLVGKYGQTERPEEL